MVVENFIEAHRAIAVPNLIFSYISYLVLFFSIGFFVANKESKSKFFALFFSISTFLGLILLAQIFLPTQFQAFFDLITSMFN